MVSQIGLEENEKLEKPVNAEQIIELIKTLEPPEIERLFILVKEYETEVRRRQTEKSCITMDKEFEKAVDKVFAENDELFKKLAEYEAKEGKVFTK
jgi:hypothetical protein